MGENYIRGGGTEAFMKTPNIEAHCMPQHLRLNQKLRENYSPAHNFTTMIASPQQ